MAQTVIVMFGVLVRIAILSGHRFHPDEALYATWARLIATGEDVWLASRVVDKPPLLLYVIAVPFGTIGASEELARIPNLVAGVVSIVLTATLAEELFKDRLAATVAALFMAASPMAVLFATTAFMDPFMLAWVLAALLAALKGKPALAGLLAGLAWASKPDAVLFGPILLAAVSMHARDSRLHRLMRFGVALLLPIALTVVWNVMRTVPDYVSMSLMNFGGVRVENQSLLVAKTIDWLRFARATGNGGLLAVTAVGASFMLVSQRKWIDILLVATGFGWAAVHILLTFPAWDRFALPLAPLFAILTGRVLAHAQRYVRSALVRRAGIAFICLAVASPVTMTLTGAAPVARDTRHVGIDAIGEYFWKTDTTATILYVHQLGWEVDYYTFGRTLDRRWFETSEELSVDAANMHAAKRFLLLAAWEGINADVQSALLGRDLRAVPVVTTYSREGNPVLQLYRIADDWE